MLFLDLTEFIFIQSVFSLYSKAHVMHSFEELNIFICFLEDLALEVFIVSRYHFFWTSQLRVQKHLLLYYLVNILISINIKNYMGLYINS